MRALIAALALLAAAPSAAQTAPSAPTPVPAEMLAPNEEARALFEALPSNVMTDEMIETMFRSIPAEAARGMDAAVEQILAPGELVPGWRTSGIDLLPAIAARAGGLAGNMAEGDSRFGRARVYFVDRPIESFARPEWVLVARHGAPFSADTVQVMVVPLSPKLTLVERIGYRRQDNAYCQVRAEARFYADPAVAASEADMIALIITMRSFGAIERRGMCEIVEEAGPGEYRTRMFDGEGHRLPAAEGVETFRIVARRAPGEPH